MKKEKNTGSAPAILRQKAEKLLKNMPLENGSHLIETESLRLIHELQVQQIELELQNEELRLAKEEAEIASKKYSELYDFAPSGYFTLSKEGMIIELNHSAANMLSKQRSVLINSRFGFFVSDETKPIFNLFLRKIFSNQFRENCEVTLSLDNNLPKYIYLSGIITANTDQCVVNAVDISKHMLAAEELIESEQRYRSLFEESNDAIFLLDLESGRYIDCNRLAETLTGYTHEEILILKAGAFLPTLRKQEAVSNIELIVSHNAFRKETEIITKGGKLIPVEFNSSLVTINKKQCIMSMLHDISDRRVIEEELRQSEENVKFKLQSILSPEGSISDLELNDIIDAPTIQKLMGHFYELVRIPIAILDINGKVLVGVGWQDICAKFHRVHPESFRNCYESDVHLTRSIPDGEFRLYKCKNNMWDIATPLIIGGEHKGNLFMGQFFFDNEPIEYRLFREQADQYGFKEQEYLKALDKVPRISLQKLDHAKAFFLNLSRLISNLSYGNIKLARAIEQQKKVEDELREKDELLNKAQEIAHLGSWSLDLGINVLTWSDEMYRIFDVQPHEFPATYEGFLDSVHHEDRDAVNSAYTNSILEGKDSYEIEHRIFRKHKGEIRNLLEKCEHVRDASGKIIRSVGMTHDITELKKSAEALRENERLFRESQSVAHIGSYSGDLIQKTWKGTPAIYEIFGIDETYPNTFDGWIRCIHPDYRAKLTMDLFQKGNKNNLFENEYKIIRVNDGAERWVHGLGKFEYDNQMNPVRLIGTIQDITIRKQAEEALKRLNEELDDRVKERTAELLTLNNEIQQTKEKYRTVADHTYDWEYWISEEDDIYYMSPSVERITGYSAEEFIANPQLLNQIVFPDDLRLWKNHITESHMPDPDIKIYEIEIRIVSKTGDIHWIGHVCKGIFRDGKYLGLRVSNRDITERVKAENELLNVTVEVEERERNRFSFELHDDLGPLLSTIKLYFQWLSETDNPEKRKIITEKGNNSIERAIQTTREIAHGLGSQLVNNIGYVGAILQFIQIINDTQKLKVDFNFNSDDRFSNFQEVILYRITKELINNTLKHAGATHVEIEFNHHIEKNITIFTYMDNGIGFDLENVEKSNKGLGLINMQRKIKLMKGIFSIETGTGKGIKVDVVLPFDGVPDPTQTKKSEKQKMST